MLLVVAEANQEPCLNAGHEHAHPDAAARGASVKPQQLTRPTPDRCQKQYTCVAVISDNGSRRRIQEFT
jgi:hypothetical protein